LRFWDSSAIVPLLIGEPEHSDARATFEHDPEMVAWWGTSVEVVSALARREREGRVRPDAILRAMHRLDGLAAAWQEVEPSDQLRQSAIRVLRVHPLRAADAFQLAAALSAAEGYPSTLGFVTFDDRLADAAQREGFSIVPS